MKVIISDIDIKNKVAKEDILIVPNSEYKNCIGCFACWIKTPKHCILNDGINNMGEVLLKADELVLVSKNVYGCYSSFVKMVLERSIGYVEPYFTLRNGEIHHLSRTDKKLDFTVNIYGNTEKTDRALLRRLAIANMNNINTNIPDIRFLKKWEDVVL